MRRLMVMIFLAGVMAAPGFSEETPGVTPALPVRLANGIPIEGTLTGTNVEGLVFQAPKGVVTYPWKYLSQGTRYRHERPWLAKTAKIKPAVAPPKPVKTAPRD